MDNQHKTFEPNGDSELAKQFKKASESLESKEFPSADKIWSRVEEKLDRKVLTKQHNLWKKIAIAASVLLFFTLAYQIFKPELQVNNQKNEIVVTDSIVKSDPITPEKPIVNTETPNPEIKKEAAEMLQQQLEKPISVAMEEHPKNEMINGNDDQEAETDLLLKSAKASPSAKSGRFHKGQAFDAVGIRRANETPSVRADKKTASESVGNAEAPLVIVDGKAITGKDALQINTISEGIAKVDPKDEKEVVVLKEPLYIINGHYYSEQELFGPNPTSPYAPLNQQEIETISILQGEKAIMNYGKRGEKGVVIITTKDRKPAQKSETKASTPKAK